MNKIITLQRNMDDGYVTVYCVQKQFFQLIDIHNYFQVEDAFDTIDALITFLEVKQDENDYFF